MNELERMRKLAGILTEGVMAVPGVGSESNMQTAGNAARGANYAAFDTAQPQVDEAAPNLDLEIQSALEMLEELENDGMPDEQIIDSIESSFRADGFSDEDIAGVLAAVQQHIENPPEDEEQMCSSCNGSGEGMYDGSRCSSCGGSGVDRGQNDSDDFDDPVDEYDPADDIYEESVEDIEEAFDLNNGYDDINFMAPGDFFPDGADSPVTSRVGPSGARMGDNPEQKKMAVAETHKELVYNYRKFLNEEKSKDVLNKRIPGGLANKNVALDYKNMKKNKGGKIDKMFPLGGPKKGAHLPEEKSPKK